MQRRLHTTRGLVCTDRGPWPPVCKVEVSEADVGFESPPKAGPVDISSVQRVVGFRERVAVQKGSTGR